MSGAERTTIMEGEPREIYDVVVDYETYPQFFDEHDEVKILECRGNTQFVRFTADYGKRFTYVLKIEHFPDRLETSWTYEKGDLRDNEGGWRFETAAPGKTRIYYRVDIKLSLFVPRAIMNRVAGMQIPKMFEKLQAEVRRRRAARSSE